MLVWTALNHRDKPSKRVGGAWEAGWIWLEVVGAQEGWGCVGWADGIGLAEGCAAGMVGIRWGGSEDSLGRAE